MAREHARISQGLRHDTHVRVGHDAEGPGLCFCV